MATSPFDTRLEEKVDPQYLKTYPAFVVRLQRISCNFTVFCQTKLPSSFSIIALGVHYLFKDEVMIILTPCTAWLVDYDYAIDLILGCGVSELINGLIKWCFCYPRPCFIDSRIRNIRGAWEEDYGFPSSHTMLMQTFTFMHIFHYLTKDQSQFTLIMIPVLLFLVLLTSFTRVYLGLHFIHDVVAGVLVAPLFAYGSHCLRVWLESQVFAVKVEAALLVPMTIGLLMVTVRLNVPSESVVQRRIWGDRAYVGYAKSKGLHAIPPSTSFSPKVQTASGEYPHSSQHRQIETFQPSNGGTGQHPRAGAGVAESVFSEDGMHPRESLCDLTRMSVNGALGGPQRPSEDYHLNGLMRDRGDSTYRFHPENGASPLKQDTPAFDRFHPHPQRPYSEGYVQGSQQHQQESSQQEQQLHLHPRRFDRYAFAFTTAFGSIFGSALMKSSKDVFNPCPIAFSKRRVVYWGFGFGGLVLFLTVLMGVVGPMVKKAFPQSRWIRAIFQVLVMTFVVLWTTWLSWMAMFAIRPEWELC